MQWDSPSFFMDNEARRKNHAGGQETGHGSNVSKLGFDFFSMVKN